MKVRIDGDYLDEVRNSLENSIDNLNYFLDHNVKGDLDHGVEVDLDKLKLLADKVKFDINCLCKIKKLK